MKIFNVLFIATALALKFVKSDNTRQLKYEEYIESKDFHYNFRCLDNFNDACDVAKEDFKTALDILSNTFEFYEPLNFEVIVDDLSKYGLDNATGGAMDINFVPLKSSNSDNVPPYLYTQAQAKQLKLDYKIEYKKNDFIMVLNNFKIDPDSMEKFAIKRYSRFIVHEIIHAMGFTINEVIDELKDTNEVVPLSPGYISTDGSDKYKFLPSLIVDMNWDKLGKAKTFEEYINSLYDSKLKAVYPLSIFSKYIVDIETKEKLFENLELLYKEYDCFEEDLIIKDITSKKCYKCYNELSEKTKKSIDNITEHFLKSKSIGFLINKEDVVPLQTFNNAFFPGNSVIHTQFDKNDEINDDPDKKKKLIQGTLINKKNIFDYYNKEALMYYTQSDAITNDEFIETIGKDNYEGLIGQDTIDILKTLGWNKKGEKKSDDTYYYDSSISIPEKNTFKFVNMKLYELTTMPLEDYQEREEQEQKQQEEQEQEEQKQQGEQEQEQKEQKQQEEEKQNIKTETKLESEKEQKTVLPPKLEL
ncbi:hypothetical protein BCR36DRAFT_354699 [Piromyces finnis]|uniref:Sequence orphan n=1 Tax=Piromyces finnis TaxID=1754191 RepID=A0A1Y1V6L8_9FUNG|nr:hypothetical protein BCR36DRAFT_354699 [Piromyces finnis]|eukprot:ORX48391.1 hypothetical protein BCR36DRAFT_354699 [Piromyces finnis]